MGNEIISLLRDLIREEFIGSKGGVRYYQMGGSLPDELYNLNDKGDPARDPGVPGLKKSRARRKKEKALIVRRNSI